VTSDGAPGQSSGEKQGRAPAGKRVAGLDGVRGLAVLLVVLSHARVPYFGAGGIEGVTAFFTLSGFLITGLLLKEFRVTGRLDLPAFWARRALRLLPALFVFVGVTGLMFWVAGWAGRSTLIGWSKPVLLYYSNFALNWHVALGPFRHTWSLGVEEQFYLMWPLLLLPALLLTRRLRSAWVWLLLAMAGATALSLGWRVAVGMGWWGFGKGGWVVVAPQTTIFSMTAGACLAVLHQRGWRPGRWAGPVALLGLSAYFWLPDLAPAYAGWVMGPALYTGVTLVVLACTSGDRTTVFSWRPLRALGTVSYGWYLWHFPFALVLAGHLFKVRHEQTATWLGMITSLVIAAMSWQYVEKPLQRRFRGRLERVRLTDGVATAGLPAPAPVPAPATAPAADPAADDVQVPGPADAPVADQDRVIDLTALERRVPR
jgi:peptidoglycan/LPS O-acetylase OafA/YrhL